MPMEYFRCKACRKNPFSGTLVRKGYGDNCIACGGLIEEHEEGKRYAQEVKDRSKRRLDYKA
jgi:hypothetical protein